MSLRDNEGNTWREAVREEYETEVAFVRLERGLHAGEAERVLRAAIRDALACNEVEVTRMRAILTAALELA